MMKWATASCGSDGVEADDGTLWHVCFMGVHSFAEGGTRLEPSLIHGFPVLDKAAFDRALAQLPSDVRAFLKREQGSSHD